MSLDSRSPRWHSALLVVPVLVVLFVVGCVTGRGQPHMRAAIDHLQAARAELQSAVADKGGHRAKAKELVDRAIGEVEAGMEYATSR
jgi:hypothetical protein